MIVALLLILVALVLAIVFLLRKDKLLVVPNAAADVDANWGNDWPFNFAHARGQRYQQAYAASEFPPHPIVISEIHFRPNGHVPRGEPFKVTIAEIQINMSTTTRTLEGLSNTYADNVGADETIVAGPGPLTLSSDAVGEPARDFDIVIPLETLFRYDPSAGNLLLDVRNYSGGRTTQFDAYARIDNVPIPIARIWGHFGDVNDNTAENNQPGIGLVTEFVYKRG